MPGEIPDRPETHAPSEEWRRSYLEHGGAFDTEKKMKLQKFLQKFDREFGLGDAVVDLGAGPEPVSRIFSDRPRVEVDLAKKRTQERSALGILEVRADLDQLFDAAGGSSTEMKTIIDFLKRVEAKQICYLASDVLNYVDWKNFFRRLDNIVSPASTVVINNRTHYGLAERFSDTRPASPDEINDFFLHTLGYQLLESREIQPDPNDPDRETHVWYIFKKP